MYSQTIYIEPSVLKKWVILIFSVMVILSLSQTLSSMSLFKLPDFIIEGRETENYFSLDRDVGYSRIFYLSVVS